MLTRKLTWKMQFATWPDSRHVSEKSFLGKRAFDLVSDVQITCKLTDRVTDPRAFGLTFIYLGGPLVLKISTEPFRELIQCRL